MKLSKKEIFNLELEKDELVFLLKMLDEIHLDKNSSTWAVEMLDKFKQLKQQLTNKPQQQEEPSKEEVKKLVCEVCEINEGTLVSDPADSLGKRKGEPSSTIIICSVCYEKRLKTLGLVKDGF